MATIDDIISNQQAVVAQAISNANSYAGRVSFWSPSQTNPSFTYRPDKPTMAPPMKFSDLLSGDTTDDLKRFLDDQVDALMAKFFPHLLDCQNSPEAWACKIIGGEDPYGDSAGIFTSVWQQARDQEAASRNTATRRLHAAFSARGFTIPPGAMLGAQLEMEQASADAVAQVNRDEMRRATEIKMGLLQFAVQQAAQIKMGVLGVLADFYRTWIDLPQKHLEEARMRAQVYSAFNLAMSAYWNVELGWEQLEVECRKLKAAIAVDVDRNRANAVQGADSRNSALASIANAMASIAAAASDAQSGLAIESSGG